MKNHFIIAGFGRVGQMVYSEFERQGVEAVVVENSAELSEQLDKHCPAFIEGDSTEDEVLIEAGINQARGMVITIPSEADAVFLSLTARQLNPNIFIIARADSRSAEKKLKRAGANRVVMPHEIGGKRMALSSLRPNVVDFMSIGTFGGDLGLEVEELQISPGSRLDGLSLVDSKLRTDYNVSVLGIKKKAGSMQLNPKPDTRIDGGDILIVIGESKSLERLEPLTRTS